MEFLEGLFLFGREFVNIFLEKPNFFIKRFLIGQSFLLLICQLSFE
jgi:hypothetical protein